MKKHFSWFLLTLFAVLCSFFYAVLQKQLPILHFINSYFMIGLSYLLIGLFSFILQKGVFSLFLVSMKKHFTFFSRHKEFVEQLDQEKTIDNQLDIAKPLTLSGAFTCVTGLIAAILFMLYP